MSRGDAPTCYVSADEDSDRWSGFPFRAGRHRHQHPVEARHDLDADDLPPARVPRRRSCPRRWPSCRRGSTGRSRPGRGLARLAAQPHRRFIKTHTPLDGVPLDPRASTSSSRGTRWTRPSRCTTRATTSTATDARAHRAARVERGRPGRPPLHDVAVLVDRHDAVPAQDLDSLPGVMWHLSDALVPSRPSRTSLLVHYDALAADLEGEMRRLVATARHQRPDAAWPDLVDAAKLRPDARPRRSARPRRARCAHRPHALLPARIVGGRCRTALRRRTRALSPTSSGARADRSLVLAPPRRPLALTGGLRPWRSVQSMGENADPRRQSCQDHAQPLVRHRR